jgi:hypothetical protein
MKKDRNWEWQTNHKTRGEWRTKLTHEEQQ